MPRGVDTNKAEPPCRSLTGSRRGGYDAFVFAAGLNYTRLPARTKGPELLTANHKLDEVWAEGRRRVAEIAGDVFVLANTHIVAQAESPIEELFLVALCCQADAEYRTLVKPQHCIGPYRVDVLLEWWDDDFPPEKQTPHGEVVIELDGHDFHEKTKQQVRRDKQRDRYLTGEQYRVARYAGSEVWADPFACASDAIHIAAMAFYEKHGMARR